MRDDDGREVTMKEYVDQKVDALEKLIALQASMIKEQTSLIAAVTEKRLEGMNEFRASNNDLATRTIPRVECESRVQRFRDDIESLKKSRDELSGKASQMAVNIVFFLSFCSLLISIITLIMRSGI